MLKPQLKVLERPFIWRAEPSPTSSSAFYEEKNGPVMHQQSWHDSLKAATYIDMDRYFIFGK